MQNTPFRTRHGLIVETTTNNRTAIVSNTQVVTGTSNTSLLDLAALWNTSSNPSAIKLNITNVASNANSTLMNLQVDSNSRFIVDAAGNVLVGRINSTVGQGVKLDVAGGINASAVLVNGVSLFASTNVYTQTVGAASNSYAQTVGSAGNTYTNAVGAASNSYAQSVGTAGNTISVAAFATANAALPNTSGVSFNGTLVFPSGNLLIGRTNSTVGSGVKLDVNGSANVASMIVTNALGVGTAPSTTTGEIRATNEITAYYSDERLKDNIEIIENAAEKLKSIKGIYYVNNDVAKSYGFNREEKQVGVIAQDISKVLPEAVRFAPFDIDENGKSISGKNYMTVKYELIVPLLIEALKDALNRIEILENKK